MHREQLKIYFYTEDKRLENVFFGEESGAIKKRKNHKATLLNMQHTYDLTTSGKTPLTYVNLHKHHLLIIDSVSKHSILT